MAEPINVPVDQRGDQHSDQRRDIEQLDFNNLDPRIAARLNVTLARQPGTMPDGWMGSFNPDDTTVAQLAAAEWDGNMVQYARALRMMAQQADTLLAEVPDTPENRAAIYSARRALLSEADIYYDESTQRPGVALSAIQHWLGQTTRYVKLARSKNFSADDIRTIIKGRMQSVETEYATLLGFVETGGWKNTAERTRFCAMVHNLTDTATHDKMLTEWQTCGGGANEFEPFWNDFKTIVDTYQQQFLEQAAPEQTPILGEQGVRSYLEKLGIAETPRELIEWCKQEADAVRAELERIKLEYPEVTEQYIPEADAIILAEAEHARDFYITQFIESNVIPSGVDIRTIEYVIRDSAEANDLNFASISPDGKVISMMPATAEAVWSTNWAHWSLSVVHELTHGVQQQSDQVEKGWMSLEAQEGAAVAMEWLAAIITTENNPRALYRMLQSDLRRTIRMQLGLEYHSGYIDDSTLESRSNTEAQLETEHHQRTGVELVQNSLFMNGAYWFGPRYIMALAKAEHDGNLKAAIRHLAHTTGLRLPGHVLIRGAELGNFKLTEHLSTTPISVQIAQRNLNAQ